MAQERRRDPLDDALTPSAREALERAEEGTEARLGKHEVRLDGSESVEELVEMLNAVEYFDAARARLGASSMTNTHESSRPEDTRFVIPERRADESPRGYSTRVRKAADELR